MQAQDAADEAAATRAVERDMQLVNEIAEERVLAALLWASPSLPDDLDHNMFHHDAHRIVADHAVMLRQRGREPDMTTLVDELIEHGQLAAAGGAVYISKLYEDRPMSTETIAALAIVQRNFYRRRAEEARYKLVQAAANWASPTEVQRLLGEVTYWEELQAGAAGAAWPNPFPFFSVGGFCQKKNAQGIIADINFLHTTRGLFLHTYTLERRFSFR